MIGSLFVLYMKKLPWLSMVDHKFNFKIFKNFKIFNFSSNSCQLGFLAKSFLEDYFSELIANRKCVVMIVCDFVDLQNLRIKRNFQDRHHRGSYVVRLMVIRAKWSFLRGLSYKDQSFMIVSSIFKSKLWYHDRVWFSDLPNLISEWWSWRIVHSTIHELSGPGSFTLFKKDPILLIVP